MQTICFSGQVRFGQSNKESSLKPEQTSESAKTEGLEFHEVLPIVLANAADDMMKGQIDKYLKTPRGSSEAIDRMRVIDTFRRITPGTIPLRLASGQPVISKAISENRYALFDQCLKDMNGNFPDPQPNANGKKLTPLQKKLISQQIELQQVGKQAVRQTIFKNNTEALDLLKSRNALINDGHCEDAAQCGAVDMLNHMIDLKEPSEIADKKKYFKRLRSHAMEQQEHINGLRQDGIEQSHFNEIIDSLKNRPTWLYDKLYLKKNIFSAAKAGANLDVSSEEDLTPMIVMMCLDSADGVKALCEAGADVNKTDQEGNNLAHYAAIDDKVNILKNLLKAGVDVNKQNNGGRTPAHCAVAENRKASLQVLLEAGADVNKTDHEGFTPTHYAAQTGSTDALNILIKAGADVNRQSPKKHTPADIAAKANNQEALALLQKHGARFNQFKPVTG